ncbi:MAG: FHA domain-containing protein [Thermoanaerobaculia bacterium]
MIIECPQCRSKYQYDEERFERKPSKKIKCSRCQQIFEILNPAFAPREAEPVAAGDATYAARERREPGARETQPTKSAPLPHESTEQSPIPEPAPSALQLPAGKRLSLAILGGPDAGSVFRIEKPRVTIGRSNADLTLNDSEASRAHAAVEVRDTLIKLLDLGSTNGTLVDGTKITEPVELTDKAEFQVGATTLMLIVTDDHG